VWRWAGPHGLDDLQCIAARRQPVRGGRRYERLQVGLARNREVERLEALGGRQGGRLVAKDAPPQPHTSEIGTGASGTARPSGAADASDVLRARRARLSGKGGRVIAGAYRRSVNGLAVRESTRRINGVATMSFEHVTKRYPDGLAAVKDLNLEIADGEFMILVGPSGSGKSTALRMVAALEDTAW